MAFCKISSNLFFIYLGIHLFLYSTIIQIVRGIVPPQFEFDRGWLNLDGERLSENADIGYLVGEIEASNPDNPLGDITFSIAEDSQGYDYFDVTKTSATTANVTLKERVDYESADKTISIEWILVDEEGETSDGSQSGNMATVEVVNENDNFPTFFLSVYNADLSEDVVCGISTVNVSASDDDQDDFNVISFKVSDDYYKNVFTFGSESCDNSGQCTGELQLSGNDCDLDYEKQQLYTFEILAQDNGNPPRESAATVYVYVNDAQDMPPEFTTFIYTVNIEESDEIGTSIINVTAIDGDKGVDPSHTIKYTIDDTEYFKIDDDTGEIKVKSHIDLDAEDIDNNGVFSLGVMAYEEEDHNQNTTTIVTIIVTDVDDNAPIFNNISYNGEVKENEINGAPVISSIQVTDIDFQYPNNNFDLYLVQSDEVFAISPSEGIKEVFASITVKDNSFLDYEESNRFFNFQICAQSTNYDVITCTNATIEVLDQNDNNPEFLKVSTAACESEKVTEFEIKIEEDHQINEEIITFKACDEDSDSFMPIIYRLEETTINENFAIDNHTGVVRLVEEVDFEKVQTHILYVVAEDNNGVDGREASARLTIAVQNVNDIAPEFPQSYYIASMPECQQNYANLSLDCNEDVVQVYAIDEEGDQVIYQITGGTPEGINDNFKIDSESGMISLNGSIDYEEVTVLYLEVNATNFNSSFSSQAMVEIRVEGQNDNIPHIDSSDYWASVQEYPEVDLDNNTVLVVLVDDQDRYLEPSGQESPYSYQREFDCRIQSGSADHFSIISSPSISGCEVKVEYKFLDRDLIPMYNLSITAIDRGNPPLTSSAMVHVTVYDANNKAPYFLEEDISVDISEGSKLNDSVLQLNATDNDQNPSLFYSIESISALDKDGDEIDDTSVSQQFGIDPNRGNVYVNQLLDREAIPQYSLKVQVVDLNTADKLGEAQSGRASLQITVTDENDNSPVFEKKLYEIDIPIEEEIQGVIVQVTATDADEGSNAEVTYAFTSQIGASFSNDETKSVNYFEVSEGGEISTSKVFYQNDYDYYILTVVATDSGGRTDSTQVKIYLRKTDETVEIIVDADNDQLEEVKEDLMKDLAEILGYKTCFSRIEVNENPEFDVEESENVITVYCQDYNDTVVPRTELENEISNKEKEIYDLFLEEYGFTILKFNVPDTGATTDNNASMYLLYAICIVALLIIILLLFINFQMRRRYKRLKAATDPEHDKAAPETSEYGEIDFEDSGAKTSIPVAGKNVRNNPLFGVDTVPDDNHDSDSIDENEVNPQTESARNSYKDDVEILALPEPSEEVYDNNYLLLAALDEHEQERRQEKLQQEQQRQQMPTDPALVPDHQVEITEV